MTQNAYVPGVCNIGPEEIARRRNIGWGALAVTIILLALLIWTDANPWWRLLAFFPAMMSASGFLQAQFQFCTGFAHRGVFNFGQIGLTQPINDPAALAKDRKQGNRIMWYAILIGVVVAIASVVL